MGDTQKEYDYMFKLVIVGDSGVGKSSILIRFTDDQFADELGATIGIELLKISSKNHLVILLKFCNS